MKSTLIILLVFLGFSINAQNFYLFKYSQFKEEKISVISVNKDTVTIKLYVQASERCECNEFEIIKITRNDKGDFEASIYDLTIILNLYNEKINSLVVQSEGSSCCSITEGNYILKPSSPAGKTVDPQIQSLNVAPKRFFDFWNDFQSKMQYTDSIFSLISFPYGVDCNYLDASEVSESEFKEKGIDVFFNGNAFISNVLSSMNYPKNKGLFLGMYNDKYMSDKLRSYLENKYGNLKNIFVVADFNNFENYSSGYKAYFHETNGNFQFVGFEGYEQGD